MGKRILCKDGDLGSTPNWPTMKIKVFEDRSEQLEHKVNKWLSDNKRIEIISLTQSTIHYDGYDGGFITLTILYKDKSKLR